jgi:hypothetical protein
LLCPPEFKDPVFAKTSPTRSFSVIEFERFQLVFAKTGSINSDTVDAGCSLGDQLSDVEFHILDESDNISGVHSIWFSSLVFYFADFESEKWNFPYP